MGAESIIYLAILIIGIFLFICYSKIGKFLRCIFFTAFSGLFALGAICAAGIFFPVPLTATPLTLLVSGVMGIPGVLAMLVLQLI